jgi:hypothetical protein
MARIQELGATNDGLSKDLSRSFQSAHINFLIGSGASYPAIPLAGEVERQIEALQDAGNLGEAALRICSLLRSVQEPTNCLVNRVPNATETATLGAYQTFVRAIQTILTERRTTVLPRPATIFTTNYDIFIERAARSCAAIALATGFDGAPATDEFAEYSSGRFFFTTYDTGNLYDYRVELASLNLVKLHGCVSWQKDTDRIVRRTAYSMVPADPIDAAARDAFIARYAVILPQASKFHRTVGDASVIGQSLTLDNHPATIVGVLPRMFRGVTFGEVYDVVLPLGAADLFRTGPVTPSGTRTPISRARNMGWLTLMGRRQPRATDAQIARGLEPVFRQSIDEMIAPIPLEIRKQLNLGAAGIRVNVRAAALGASSGMRRALEPTLRVLAVVVVLVLLIACANLAGLFLGQALNRQREFGLRLALGAKRSRLMRQVVTESLLLAALGGAAGLLLAQWIAPAAFTLATDETGLRAVDLQPDRWVLTFTAFLSIVVALTVGATSVLRASRAHPQEVLRNVGRAASPRLAKALVAAQIAFTITHRSR